MPSSKFELRGLVVSGVGVAWKYVKEYEHIFERLLGAKPYPGTLNVLLPDCYSNILAGVKPHVIQPPRPGLCEAYVYAGWLGGIRVVIVKPAKTVHDCRVVEVVAPVKLRDLLGIKDGDVVKIEIDP